jgi:predicted nucleic acid-binding protein
VKDRLCRSLIRRGEVLYLLEHGLDLFIANRAVAAIVRPPLRIVEVSCATMLAAVHVKAPHALSYAYAFAVVTSRDHHCVLLTRDPKFRSVADQGLKAVEWLTLR